MAQHPKEPIDPDLSHLTPAQRKAKQERAGRRYADWDLDDMIVEPLGEDAPADSISTVSLEELGTRPVEIDDQASWDKMRRASASLKDKDKGSEQ